MRGIAVYPEGGGPGPDTREALRLGMDAFPGDLRTRARAREMNRKLVACGGRDEAFAAWSSPTADTRYPIRLLLVDSEGPVSGGFADHLANRREDRWPISHTDEERIHLMIQFMETWIAADPSALTDFHGAGFRSEALPSQHLLEGFRKKQIEAALTRATKATGKGRYHKTRHAPALPARIAPHRVRERCPAGSRLFTVVGNLIQSA